MMATKAYAYVRVSGVGQADGHGPDRQREAIADYAASHGLEVVDTFEDLGVSGTLDDRPGLGALLLALETDGVRTVVIERLDRLARDLSVQEAIIARLNEGGFKLHSVVEGDGLLADDPTRKLMRQVLGAVAEYDKAMTVLKLRAARDAKRARGERVEGPKPFGADPARPHERETVARIRELRRKRPGHRPARRSYRTIAGILDDEGHATRRGGPWRACSVRSVVKGDVYREMGQRGTSTTQAPESAD